MRLLRTKSLQIQQFTRIGSPSASKAIRTTCPNLPDECVSLILSDKSSEHITRNGFFHSEPASKTNFTSRFPHLSESITRDSIEESKLNSIDSIYESPLTLSLSRHEESLTRDSIEESTDKTQSKLNSIDSIYESPSETLSHSHTDGTLTSRSRLNGSANHHHRYEELLTRQEESLTRDSIEESTHESTLDSIDSIYESPSETVSRSHTGGTLSSRSRLNDSAVYHQLHTVSDCFVDWDDHDVLLTPPRMQYISPIRLNSHLPSPVDQHVYSSSLLQMMASIEQIRNAVNDLVRKRAEEDSLELGPSRKYLKPAGKYCARQLRNAVVDFLCQRFCTWLVAIVFGAAAGAILKKQFFKA